MELASGGWRPGMRLSTLPCTGHDPVPKANSVRVHTTEKNIFSKHVPEFHSPSNNLALFLS